MTGIALGSALLLGAAAGWPGVAIVAGVIGLALIGWRRAGLWTVALLPCVLLGSARVHESSIRPIPSTSGMVRLEGVVASGPLETGDRQLVELSTDRGRLCLDAPVAPPLYLGDRVVARGRISGLADASERRRGQLRGRGCGGSLKARDVQVLERGTGVRATLDHARRALTTTLQRAAPGDVGALLAGLVTGDDAALTDGSRDAFLVTGTSHVTAVSGSNLALIAAMLAFGLSAIGRGQRRHWQVVVAAALWLYVATIGAPPSALRAALVVSLAIVAGIVGRRPDFVTICVIVAAVQIAVRPVDFGTLAFRLSTASAIALVLGLAGREPRGIVNWVKASVVATVITQLATAPLLIPLFGPTSVYAIPANVVVAGLCAITVPFALGAALLGQLGDPVAVIASAPASLLAAVTLRAVHWFASLPGANDSPRGLAEISAWVWTACAVSLISAMSVECRAGFQRMLADLRVLGQRERAALAGAGFGSALGLVLIVLR